MRNRTNMNGQRSGVCRSATLSIITCCSLVFGIDAIGNEGALLRAGAATSNITPPIGVSIAGHMRDRTVTNIHDELHARCLVIDNAETQIAFAIVDSCMVPKHIFDAAKNRAAHITGIPVKNMLMSATHTHSAACATPVFQSDPSEAYQAFLAERIADGIVRANNHLEPVRIGWSAGAVPDEVFNRRWRMREGAIPPNPFGETGERVVMNPPRGSDDLLEPAGPTDPELWVLAVQSVDGRPVAVLANYALHYVGGVPSGDVSADYFGVFAERMTDLLNADRQDPPFVAMLSNGTSGDINNINFRESTPSQKPYEQIDAVAEKIARAAKSIYDSIQFHDWTELGAAYDEIALGVRLPSDEDITRASGLIGSAQKSDWSQLSEIYARETLLLARYPAAVPVPLQAIRVGTLVIGAIPCEVFVEIGLELKKDSPFENTFIVELANGYNGYLPTREHHELGGYETWRARSSYLEIDAATKIVRSLRGLFERLHE